MATKDGFEYRQLHMEDYKHTFLATENLHSFPLIDNYCELLCYKSGKQYDFKPFEKAWQLLIYKLFLCIAR